MDSTRLFGPDQLLVEAVSLDGALGVWARFAGVHSEVGLLTTRRGAWVGVFEGVDELAVVVDLADLTPA